MEQESLRAQGELKTKPYNENRARAIILKYELQNFPSINNRTKALSLDFQHALSHLILTLEPHFSTYLSFSL